MSQNTDAIIAQRSAGLISKSEARRALRRLAKQARWNADNADSPREYQRWTREARTAGRVAR